MSNPGREAPNLGRYLFGAGLAAIGATMVALVCLAASRSYFGFGTETDYLGGILDEALRFQRGEPLQSEFHPPLYSILIALLNCVVDDWFATGRIVSVSSAAVVLVTSFLFYRSALSESAGLGAVVALALSPLFISFGASATTDVFFTGLFCAAILLAYTSEQRQAVWLWGLTGVVVGFALLTRTNGLTLVLILAIPWLALDTTLRRRALFFGSALGGFLLPVVTWIICARLTGANAFPSEGTSVNLGLSFFMPEGVTEWADAVPFGEKHFGSTWDVIAYDPVRLMTIYAKALYNLPELLLEPDSLLAFPVSHLAIAALIYAFFYTPRKWIMLVGLLVVAQILLVSLKKFEPRYFMFVVPFIGALTGEFVRRIYFWNVEEGIHPRLRALGCLVLVGVLLIGIRHSATVSMAMVFRDEPEISGAVPIARKIVEPGANLVSRKPLLGFYAQANTVWMPAGESLSDLLAYLDEVSGNRSEEVYIYYGSVERELRPEYKDLLFPGTAALSTPLLELKSKGEPPGSWVLFRYVRDSGQ